MRGILADNNVVGQVARIAQLMQSAPWADFWRQLGLAFFRFEDIGLAIDASDVEIWKFCQANELILVTDNRNDDSPDSFAAAIRDLNTPSSLPVLTISALKKFRSDRDYQERVIVSIYDYLLRLDEIRGSGRLFLP